MKKKTNFIKLIRLWGVILLTAIGASIILLDMGISYQDFNFRADQMRKDYIVHQKQIVKREVDHAVDMINYIRMQSEAATKKVDDGEHQIQKDLLLALSRIRFGKEGYLFINRLNGDALVSNGKLVDGEKKLWEVFNKNPEKTKDIFKKEYKAALKPEGDYIYYSITKLTNPRMESPKVSFIYGIPQLHWLVGAGVYLDDIEKDIADLNTKLNHHIKEKTLYFILIVMGIIVLFWVLFDGLTRNLKNDLNLFVTFFDKAAFSDEEINLDRIRFAELDLLAKNANRMLQDKIHAQQDLFNEKERLFTTIHSIGDGVITTDISGRVALMNTVAELLTGFRADAAKGKPLTDIFTIVNAKTREKAQNPVDQALQNGKIIGLANHTLLISKEGSEYQIADSAAPIKDADGKTIGVVLVFRDVTKEYKMQEDLVQSEANLRSVFEAAKNVAFVKTDWNGKDTKIIEFSPGAEVIFGYKSEDVINRPVSILHLQEDMEKFTKVLGKRAKNKKGFSGELTLVKKSNERFPALFTIHPVFDKDGKITATIGVAIDITERKKAQEELQKTEKLKSVGTLAGGIAHDFNNILTGVFGNISIAQEELPQNHPSFKFLEEARKSMNRATRLTNQLLTFAKGGTPVKEDVSIGALVKEVVCFDLSGSNVKPVFDHPEDLWVADVDKGQIQQVFSNLTINARQAMPDGGYLSITLENVDIPAESLPQLKPGRYIRVMVQDEGTGIDLKYLNRIFDPYFSTKQTGSGLGLATTYSILKKHGGIITVDTKPGQGTKFTIYLPASESWQFKETDLSETKSLAMKHTGRILVMDDEEMIRDVASQMLENAGFSVKTAPNGEKAIEIYKRSIKEGNPFDLVIMDLTIPGGMGGKEAIKEILAIDPEAVVIVSSGYADDPVMANFVEYGFKGIITKPYAMNKLQKILTEVLKK